MKFQITLKDPDGYYDCVDDAVIESLGSIKGLNDEELDVLRDERREQISQLLGQWFEYSEYLTVEVDTEAETCTVVEN